MLFNKYSIRHTITFKIVQYGSHSPDVSPAAFRPIKFAHFLGGVEELTVVFMLTEAKLNGGDEYRLHFALARPSAVSYERIRVTLFRHVLGHLLICWNYCPVGLHDCIENIRAISRKLTRSFCFAAIFLFSSDSDASITLTAFIRRKATARCPSVRLSVWLFRGCSNVNAVIQRRPHTASVGLRFDRL